MYLTKNVQVAKLLALLDTDRSPGWIMPLLTASAVMDCGEKATTSLIVLGSSARPKK